MSALINPNLAPASLVPVPLTRLPGVALETDETGKLLQAPCELTRCWRACWPLGSTFPGSR